MTWYVLVPLLAFCLCALGDLWCMNRGRETAVPEHGRVWTLFDVGAIFVLVAHQGTRYYVGTDYFTYQQIFDNLIPGALLANVEKVPQEPLYTTVSVVVRSWTDDFTMLFLVMAALAIVPAYHAILSVARIPSVGLLFYLLGGTYLLGFNVVRQAIAIGLVLLAYSWRDKRPILAVITGLVAVGFHFAAIVPLVVILLNGIARSRSRLFLAGSVVLASLLGVFFVRLSVGASTLFGFSFVQDRYSNYFDVTGFSFGRVVLLGAFVFLLLCAWGVDRRDKFPHWMGLLGILGMAVGLNYVFVGRIAWYFLVFLLIPLAGRSRGPWAWMFRSSAVCGAVLIYAATIFTSSELLPYSSWLFAAL